ncbi:MULTISPECIES: DnaJ C-terminal domain-containing protein [unclassified Nocardioides]|uniref:DnaJ C-terminal domain-containing protein n=1 Tax=unclassified Nocardioides TaxID=2615069 RepID=UPI0009F144D4|nr:MULTISPECIES: DnaJ C-terminal domain-containing protein [unclassified Nocardioides]GAW48678.1 heat shock protein DnaJ domain-containing protein [Nocardioides sp. PD653-B2]GAW54223.1 heat shock protein DnaJ domain-containing protein [Nocardioides sp. PD653]
MTRDFYETLGVPRAADQAEIQRAFRRLARQHHPDVNKDPGAEERFKEVSEAYDVLSDPEQRQRYDAFGEDFRRVSPDADPDAPRRSRAYAGAGARPGAGGGVRFTDFGDDVDLEELLGGVFGGRGRGRPGWGRIPGSDHETEVEVTVDEAFHGTRRSLTITGPEGPRTIDVDIPAGVVDGQRIRLRGQGGQGSGGADAGDLYLVARIAPDRRYRLEGRNLHVTLPLAPWEAALGTEVDLESPAGKLKVTVPAGTSSGRRLRLAGQGLPHRGGKHGDLFAEAQIMVPEKLTPDERRHFEQLAKASAFDPRSSR